MSTLDVVAYAGENHGGVKPANFLDIGGGASAEVMAAGLDVILGDPQVKSVFVNVFGGITACDAVAKGIVGALAELGAQRLEAARRAPRRQQGRGGPRDPRATRTTRSSRWPKPWTKAPTRPPSSRTHKDCRNMSIFLNKDSKVIVQGITGGEGTKHTALMLKAGTQVVGGVNARKAGTTVLHRDADGIAVELPVFASVAEAIEKTGADVSIAFVPPAFTKRRDGRGHRRRDPAARRDHRGRARRRHRRGLGLRAVQGQHDPHHRAELPRHHHARRVARRHHARPTSPARARSASCRSRAP